MIVDLINSTALRNTENTVIFDDCHSLSNERVQTSKYFTFHLRFVPSARVMNSSFVITVVIATMVRRCTLVVDFNRVFISTSTPVHGSIPTLATMFISSGTTRIPTME